MEIKQKTDLENFSQFKKLKPKTSFILLKQIKPINSLSLSYLFKIHSKVLY